MVRSSDGPQRSAPGQESTSHTRTAGFPSPLGLYYLYISCALFWSERGILPVVQLPLEAIVRCPSPRESDPSSGRWHDSSVLRRQDRPGIVGDCTVCLYLWPAASMTTGEIRGLWFGVRTAVAVWSPCLVSGIYGEAYCFENGHDAGNHLHKALRRLGHMSRRTWYA